MKPLKISNLDSLLNCICRTFRKHKGHKSIQKLVDSKTKQLDIRRIISNSVSLRNFFRCFLSPQQKALLAFQRTKVASVDKKAHKSCSSSEEEFSAKVAKRFERTMLGFVPKDSFD